MRDFREGVASDGSIVTGVSRRAAPPAFEPVLADPAETLAMWPAVSSYLYGSVATGQACVGRSDVDFLTVGFPAERTVRRVARGFGSSRSGTAGSKGGAKDAAGSGGSGEHSGFNVDHGP